MLIINAGAPWLRLSASKQTPAWKHTRHGSSLQFANKQTVDLAGRYYWNAFYIYLNSFLEICSLSITFVIEKLRLKAKSRMSKKNSISHRQSGTTRTAIAGAIAGIMLSGCGGMSDREKSMVGKYYIPAVSDTHPLIELNDDNKAVIRAIRPGELSYFVTGIWKVRDDSLIIENDASSITIEDGDPGMVGTVAPRVAYPILSYDETVLRIKRGGIIYDYNRRTE